MMGIKKKRPTELKGHHNRPCPKRLRGGPSRHRLPFSFFFPLESHPSSLLTTSNEHPRRWEAAAGPTPACPVSASTASPHASGSARRRCPQKQSQPLCLTMRRMRSPRKRPKPPRVAGGGLWSWWTRAPSRRRRCYGRFPMRCRAPTASSSSESSNHTPSAVRGGFDEKRFRSKRRSNWNPRSLCFVMAGDRSLKERDSKSYELLHSMKSICQAKKPEVSEKTKLRSSLSEMLCSLSCNWMQYPICYWTIWICRQNYQRQTYSGKPEYIFLRKTLDSNFILIITL